jgi:hypothetical protein
MNWGWLAAVIGGALWTVHGAFEMLEPFGSDTQPHDDHAFEVVTNSALFMLYATPGTLALALTAASLLATLRWCQLPASGIGLWGLRVIYVVFAFSGLALVGLLFRFVPAFVVGVALGGLALAVAAGLIGADGLRIGINRTWVVTLLAIGGFGIVTLPLRPLVFVFQVLPQSAGFAFIAAFGLAWMILGYLLSRSEPPEVGDAGWEEA